MPEKREIKPIPPKQEYQHRDAIGPQAETEEVRRINDIEALIEAGQLFIEKSVDESGNILEVRILDKDNNVVYLNNERGLAKLKKGELKAKDMANDALFRKFEGPIPVELYNPSMELLLLLNKSVKKPMPMPLPGGSIQDNTDKITELTYKEHDKAVPMELQNADEMDRLILSPLSGEKTDKGN